MNNLDSKIERTLSIFFRGLRGENVSVKKLSEEFEVSTRSVARSITDLKAFLADHRELVGNTELRYSNQDKCYHLYMDEFLSSKELLALLEVLIGTRAFSKIELLTIVDKLKKFTTLEDRQTIAELIEKELYHYSEVKHDCDSVQDTLVDLKSNHQTSKLWNYPSHRILNPFLKVVRGLARPAICMTQDTKELKAQKKARQIFKSHL